ncbi:MAG: hypothetical protein H5U04_13425 [Firmicutes bacterium]|nr:hypothetical protein [Bacillota bacterium]
MSGEKGEWVTAVWVTPGNAAGAGKAEEMVDQLRERLEARGVKDVAPVSPATRREGSFSKDEFEINHGT